MLKIELVPDLSHCVESVAKNEYNRVVSQLLTPGEENRQLQERAELLRIFLGTTDFSKLRSESERHLAEGRNVKFAICMESGVLKCEMRVG